MKENIIQLLNVAGTPTACYQLESVDNLSGLYEGQLFAIGQKGLIDYVRNVDSNSNNSEKYRFVVAKNPEEKDMLLKVEPIRCYLRDHEMNSKVIEINPYQSVRWLKNVIEQQRKCPIKLIVNEQELTQESDSMLKYIHENAIIHIIELRQNQKTIPVIYTKEPGPQSKVHRIQNVNPGSKIQQLARQISRLTSIPYELLFLIYGGHILPKDRQIYQYHIQPNGCIYAVDSRKYMKKVSKNQYQTRLAEVRKVKQSNKAVVQKVKQQNQRKIKQKTVQKVHKPRQMYEKSGQLVGELGDDTQYFKDPQMNIESEQVKQFERRANVLQQRGDNKGHQMRVQTQRFPGDTGIGTPPNSPIFLFNRQQSYGSANNELKQGRIITKDTQVYEDPLGFTHEYDKQKTIFKSGKTKIVQTNIAKDQDGNVVKIQHDFVKVKRDPQTGYTTKIETDIIEDAENGKTIIKRQQVRDRDGNVIKSETDIIKNQSGQKSNKKQQKDTITEGDKVTSFNTEVLQDAKGIPVKIETDINERKLDESGHTHQYSKDIKQEDGVTTVVQRNVIRDKQGNILQLKTDVIKITEDQQGNIYKHERNKIDKENKKVVIQRDIVTDRHGEIISKQTDMKMVEEDSHNNIHKHETDIIEGVDGRTIIIEKNIIEDSDGKIIKSETDMFQLNKGQKRQPQEMQILHGEPEAIQIQNQKQPLINAGTQVTIDELGNTHTREKQLVEKQGKTTFVDRDTVEDPRGKVIRVQTDIVQIQGDDEGNMHKHKSEIIESQGRVVMVETDVVMDPDGVTIRKQKDTIQIDQAEDGSVIKHEKDVIQEDGKTKIVEKDIVEDADGNVIRSETKITQIEEDQNVVNVHEKQQVLQAVEDDGTLLQGDHQIRKQIQVIQDEEGNSLTRQKQLIETQQGKTTVMYRNVIENAEGDILKQQTEMMHVSDQNGAPQLHRHSIDYTQSGTGVRIQQTTSRQNFDGSIIRSQKQTIQIQEQQDGNVRRKQMNVVQENGKKVVYVKNMLQDQTGKLISKTSDLIQMQSIQPQGRDLALEGGLRQVGTKPQQADVETKYNVDAQGNLHIVETQIKNNQGQQVMVERQFVSNQRGQLIKTQTGILQIQQGRDGNTRLTATDIVQEGNIVTIIQNDSIQDSQGNQIRTESGTMQIQDIGSGITRKQKQNIIQEGGVRVKVEKETYHDQQGNIIQQKVRTTELTDNYDENSGQIVSQGYKRKEKQVTQDKDGNTIWRQKQIIDKQQGQTTIVETEVIRDQSGKLVKATTDVVQMTEQQDGTVHRHETNIIQKPGKMTVAESNTLQNAEGQRLKGEVQSIVVTKGENGEIIKKQTGIIMEDLQKTIVQRVIVEDAQGNVIKAETKKKRIYTDQSGVQQYRDIENYEVTQDQIQGDPSTFEKEVIQDAQGNRRTIQRQTTTYEDGETKVVQTTKIQDSDGSLIKLETDVLQIQKSESGTQLVKQTNIIEDDKKLTVVQNSSISNREGDVLTSKTEILELVEGQDGHTKKTVTNVVEEVGRMIITEKKAVQTGDGQIIDQSMNITKIIKHQDGSVEVIENSQPFELQEQAQGQYTQVDSIIRDPVQVELAPVKQKQIIQDVQGNVHTLQKQVIINQDGTTIIKSQTVENSSGKVIVINTNIVDTKQLEDGKKLRHETEIVSGEKLVTTQIYTIQNPDGSIHSQKTRKVEIQEDDGLIKTSKVDVIRRDGQTTVTGTETLEDEDGNIIDQSNSKLDISQNEQAVRQQARKIARAEIQGQITGIVTEYHEDEDGNRRIVERETIENNGSKIVVDHQTVKNQDGEVVIVQTNIVTERQREDGKVQRHETQITQQDGKTRVIEYSQIKQDSQALQRLQNSAKSGNLSDLLGFNQDQSNPKEPGTIKYATMDNQEGEGDLLLESVKQPLFIAPRSKGILQVNLLDDSLTNSDQKIGDLPLQSRKQFQQIDFGKKGKLSQNQYPEQYEITVINKQRVQTSLTIRFDQIIDEVAEKLGNKIGQSKEKIKFYKDGNELQEYELVSDLDIIPGTQLYYYVEQSQIE